MMQVPGSNNSQYAEYGEHNPFLEPCHIMKMESPCAWPTKANHYSQIPLKILEILVGKMPVYWTLDGDQLDPQYSCPSHALGYLYAQSL